MPEPTQPNPNPDGGGSTTPPAEDNKPTPAPSTPDLSKLEGDDLAKVLENENLWKLPRIAELRKEAAEAKKLRDANAKAEEEYLTEQKQFEELAAKKGQELEQANSTIQRLQTDHALTNLLVKESVVDLDGALKLVDRSKITVNEDGTVEGLQEALDALKTDKAYLFGTTTPPRVGSASNQGNSTQTPAGQYKFKESQLTPEFYAANKDEIDLAGRQGLIEADGPPPLKT